MKKIFISLFLMTMCLMLSVSASATEVRAHFTDVPDTFWGYEAIERAYSDGIVTGVSGDATNYSGVFSPNDSLTNAQFVTILARGFFAEELDAEMQKGNTTPWYAPYMTVVKANGLLSGTGIEANPDAVATRYDMSLAMVAILESAGIEMPTNEEMIMVQREIGDWTNIPEKYHNSVSSVYVLGLITGVNNQGDFSGQSGVSRAAMCTVYCRLVDAIAGTLENNRDAYQYYPGTQILTYSTVTGGILKTYEPDTGFYRYVDVLEGNGFIDYTDYLTSIGFRQTKQTINLGFILIYTLGNDELSVQVVFNILDFTAGVCVE